MRKNIVSRIATTLLSASLIFSSAVSPYITVRAEEVSVDEIITEASAEEEAIISEVPSEEEAIISEVPSEENVTEEVPEEAVIPEGTVAEEPVTEEIAEPIESTEEVIELESTGEVSAESEVIPDVQEDEITEAQISEESGGASEVQEEISAVAETEPVETEIQEEVVIEQLDDKGLIEGENYNNDSISEEQYLANQENLTLEIVFDAPPVYSRVIRGYLRSEYQITVYVCAPSNSSEPYNLRGYDLSLPDVFSFSKDESRTDLMFVMLDDEDLINPGERVASGRHTIYLNQDLCEPFDIFDIAYKVQAIAPDGNYVRDESWRYCGQYVDTDDDGDWIPDLWEDKGVTINGDFLDLPGMGASPDKKDIFIEIDWMEGSAPSREALQMVADRFRSHGIELHIDCGSDRSVNYSYVYEGKEEPYSEIYIAGENGSFDPETGILKADVQKWIRDVNRQYLKPARKAVFHHFLFVNQFSIGGDSKIWGNGEGITNGLCGQYCLICNNNSRPDVYIAATFMHELGHGLGLDHGGNNRDNNKPNYLSIMNYHYCYMVQDGELRSDYLDYSSITLPDLDENHLSENDGFDPLGKTIKSQLFRNVKVVWFSNQKKKHITQEGIAYGKIDFNENGVIDDEKVKTDINNDNDWTILTSYNDWANIRFNAGLIGFEVIDSLIIEQEIQESIDVPITDSGVDNDNDMSYRPDYEVIYDEAIYEDINVVDNDYIVGSTGLVLHEDTHIAGNLYVKDGTLNLNGYSLIVDGDVYINKSLFLGSQKLIVFGDLYIELDAGYKLYFDTGDLEVRGNVYHFNGEISQTDSNNTFLVYGNYESGAHENQYPSYIADAGLFELKGDLTVINNGRFGGNTVLSGNDYQIITINTASSFNDLDIINSDIEFKNYLEAMGSISAENAININAKVKLHEDNGTNKLTLIGDVELTGTYAGEIEIFGNLELEQFNMLNKIIVHGDVIAEYVSLDDLQVDGDFYGYTGLKMREDADYLLVNKNCYLYYDSYYGYSSPDVTREYTAGTIELKGDLILHDDRTEYLKNTSGWFQCAGSHKTIFSGSGRQYIEFDEDSPNHLNNVQIVNDDVVIKRIGIAGNLLNDASVSSDDGTIYVYGLTLNRHTLHVDGDVSVVKSPRWINSSLSPTTYDTEYYLGIDGGTFDVDGNLIINVTEIHLGGGKINAGGSLTINSDSILLEGGSIFSNSDAVICDSNNMGGTSTHLDGGTLTVKGGLTSRLKYGDEGDITSSIMLEGGTVDVAGDCSNIIIRMEDSADRFIVHGNYFGDVECSSGTLEFYGDVTSESKFECTGNNLTIIKGNKLQTISLPVDEYLNTVHGRFNNINFENQNVKVINASIGGELLNSLDCDCDLLYLISGFTINNRTVRLNGNVVINGDIDFTDSEMTITGNLNHHCGLITFNNSRLIVEADYDTRYFTYDGSEWGQGQISMTHDTDYFLVKGNYTVSGYNLSEHSNPMTAGTIELYGDMHVPKYGGLMCSGSHRFVFDGVNDQVINIEDKRNYFNIVELNKTRDHYIFTPEECWKTIIEPGHVTSIRLDKSAITLYGNESETLVVIIEPTDAINKEVYWSSSSNSIARVEGGVVTATSYGAGEVTITATSKDNGLKATCKVTVKQHVSKIIVNQTRLGLNVGEQSQLTYDISPMNATNKKIIWSSSDSSIVSVDSSGIVTALKAGQAVITATTEDRGLTSTSTITVKGDGSSTIRVTGVSLNKGSLSLKAGSSEKLIATITPANATNRKLDWTTSNAAVATVDSNGNVKAVANGTAIITAATVDGNKIAFCNVTVTGGSSVTPTPSTPSSPPKNGWYRIDGKEYWYENGVRQGTVGRGKEIYDPGSNAWYWLDAVQGGAKALSKDVYQESPAGKWAGKADGTGKWVRYDANGYMIKGWQTTGGKTYYFDFVYGTMAKGYATIDGTEYFFDPVTGVLQKNLGDVPQMGWKNVNGKDYWYENYDRQGVSVDGSYRGKEIYFSGQGGIANPSRLPAGWYWLDNVYDGAKAANKEVYMPYTINGQDNIGKWVRYDGTGQMIKGWYNLNGKRYYYNLTTGAMTKGSEMIDGRVYQFDETTGVLK